MALSAVVLNENGRILPNRETSFQTQAPWAQITSGNYFKALRPRDTTIAVVAQTFGSVRGGVQYRIPIGTLTVHAHETDNTYWAQDSIVNWRMDVNLPPMAPPTWNGTPGDCSRHTSVSDGYVGTTFFSQRCTRTLDLPSYNRLAESYTIDDPVYAALAQYVRIVVDVADYNADTGNFVCGFARYSDFGQYCWDRITVEAYTDNPFDFPAGYLVARGVYCMRGCSGASNNRATPLSPAFGRVPPPTARRLTPQPAAAPRPGARTTMPDSNQ